MNWIRIATKMKGDPRIGAIAAACKVPVPHAVGLVTCVLMELPDHARDGDLSAVPDVILEQWALWAGRPGQFAEALRAQLCDETGLVRAWERHNGAAIREADRTRERAREWRENGKRTPRERKTNAVRTPFGTGNERGSERESYSVDGTGRKETTASAVAAAVVSGTAAATAAAEQRVAALGFTAPEHAEAALGYVRSAQFPDAVAAHFEGLVSGLSGPGGQPIAPAVLGQALHEMRVAGVVRAAPAVLAKFVSRVGESEHGTGEAEISYDQLIAQMEREAAAHAP